MSKILIQNAQAIVTVDGEDRVLYNANILVEDNVITTSARRQKRLTRSSTPPTATSLPVW